MDRWQEKRVLIIGAARQGIALARYLSAHGADVLLNDNRSESEFLCKQLLFHPVN